MAEAHLGPSFGDEGDTHQAALMASSVACTGGPLCSASRSVTDQLPHLGGREPDAVRVARVSEARSGSLASFPGAERPGGIERLDHEHPVVLERLAALVLGDEDLVELFTGANADVLDRADRKSTRLNSSHGYISYAVFCLKKKKKIVITVFVTRLRVVV